MEWLMFREDTNRYQLRACEGNWKTGFYIADVTLIDDSRDMRLFEVSVNGEKLLHKWLWYDANDVKYFNRYLLIPRPFIVDKKTTSSSIISAVKRLKILRRDKYKCCYCNKSPAIDATIILHIDHVIPHSRGGSNELDNLQVLCSNCNLTKSDKIIEIKKDGEHAA